MRRSSSGASHYASGKRDRKWTPSWLSRGASTRTDATSNSGRRISTSTTSSSTISSGTCSSIEAILSDNATAYQLPNIGSDAFDRRDCAESFTFSSISDATAALQSLAMTIPEDEEVTYSTGRLSVSEDNALPPTPRRSESRAGSIRSRVLGLSSLQSNDTAGLAEVELVAREYTGYWRASAVAHMPPAAALCGTLLLSIKFPPPEAQDLRLSTNGAEMDRAASLCEMLEEADSPDEALNALHQSGLQTTLPPVRQNLNDARLFEVPEKMAWAMYENIAEARTHPKKIVDLWHHISNLFRTIPQNVLVVIVFLLSIARRIQSRGILVNGGSPAVFLLLNIFPRYVEEDISRILLKNYEHLPEDLPPVLESVNCRFSGRKCNVLDLFAAKRQESLPLSSKSKKVQEIRIARDDRVQR